MARPSVFFDPQWRQRAELFSDADDAALEAAYDVLWGRDEPASDAVVREALAAAEVYVAATPRIDPDILAAAPNLRAVIEVSGAFPDTIDYAACDARGIEVLSCAPGFRQSVAEMCLAMMLSGGRGLVEQHEAFRQGTEAWLADREDRDRTLYGATVGFIGYGQIAREVHRLIAPFRPTVLAHDPWLDAVPGVSLGSLEDVMAGSDYVIVAAAPTAENLHLIGTEALAALQDNALLVLISRAHLVDFDALTREVSSGRIKAAIDVFPDEPLAGDHPVRGADGAILSPHRAAAVKGGRHLIGRMILDDLAALFDGRPERRLSRFDLARIGLVAGVGDAASVADMAVKR